LTCAVCGNQMNPYAEHWRNKQTLARVCGSTCRDLAAPMQQMRGDVWVRVEARAVAVGGGR